MATVYDPPSGWLYGFPKEYHPRENEQIQDTLIRDGYPPKDASWAAKHCRFWNWEPHEVGTEEPTEENDPIGRFRK